MKYIVYCEISVQYRESRNVVTYTAAGKLLADNQFAVQQLVHTRHAHSYGSRNVKEQALQGAAFFNTWTLKHSPAFILYRFSHQSH